MKAKQLGFFTRLLDQVEPGERYRLAAEQICCAEQQGFDSAWVAQHHFVEEEGGLPAPFVFLAHVAAQTSRIRLGTGIVTLPLEMPLRVAEDAAVLDLLCGGRLEVGMGPGGTPSAFAAFGQDSDARSEIFQRYLEIVRKAWVGQELGATENRLYPTGPSLAHRVWQATFSVGGGARAGRAGDGLMLSRTQPRTAEAPYASLYDIQMPIIDAYMEALPPGHAPRILGSRSVFIADDRDEARHFAAVGLRRNAERLRGIGRTIRDGSVDEMIASMDSHVGTPDDVVGSLEADKVLDHVTDLTMQVHSIDPPHPFILRSIELMGQIVAPALGWQRQGAPVPARFAVAG